MACLQLEQQLGGLILEDALISFEDVILSRLPRYNHEILLPGVVTKFDLPDLYGALCPTPLTLLNPLRADKTPAARAAVDEAFARTRTTYSSLDRAGSWSVVAGVEGPARSRLILETMLSD
jgi:hypothetical protein